MVTVKARMRAGFVNTRRICWPIAQAPTAGTFTIPNMSDTTTALTTVSEGA